ALISSISQMEKRLNSLERLDFTETIQEGEVFKEFEKGFISILGLQRALESLSISVKNASSSITSSIEKEKESMKSLAQVGEGINSLIAKVNQSGSELTELLSLIEKSTEEMKLAISEISKNTTNTASKAKALRTTAEEMEGSVLNLERAMQQIRDISDTIKGIAEQTNLLALNASIEAARAGEAGKGFAVVANEVKELAKKVSDFIGEIEKIVDELQVMVAETVNKTKESTKMVDEVEEATSMIAGAVEEQTAVVANIAENTMQSKEKSFSLISEIEDLNKSSKILDNSIKEISMLSQLIAEIGNTFDHLNSLLKIGEEEIRDEELQKISTIGLAKLAILGHINWKMKFLESALKGEVPKVERDHRRCILGRSEVYLKQRLAGTPLIKVLEDLEEPHRELHGLVEKFEKINYKDKEEVISFINKSVIPTFEKVMGKLEEIMRGCERVSV
ncbi:MAG: methyl-accepting chemotaxis protein, partial [Thermodesulfobacteriaceae bacterium]|nr:methyl-accepting chemotaxis protein [Thermodesulfobacteriaceae bacterium]